MKPRSFAVILSILCLPLLAGSAFCGETIKVKKDDLQITMDLNGAFVPADPVELKFEPEGYKGAPEIEEVAKNGKFVKKGDVILRLKKKAYEEMLVQKRLDLKIGALRLEDAGNARHMLNRDLEFGLASVERAAQWAEKNWKAYLKFELPLSDKEYIQRRKYSDDSIKDQKMEIEQLGKMYSEDELTEETEEIVLMRAKRALQRSIAALEIQDKRRKHSLELQRPQSLETMERGVEAKKWALEKTMAQQKNSREIQDMELRKKEIQFEKQEEDFRKLEKDGALFVLRAPRSGILFHGKAGAPNQAVLKPKGVCRANTTLFTICSSGDVKAQCPIIEKDVFRLRPNMKAAVEPIALADKKLKGVLEPLDLLPGPDKNWKGIIKLTETDSRLLPTMNCKVKIVLEELNGVLLVPKNTVFKKEGKTICYVKTAAGHDVREVNTGKNDGKRIVIESGLREGEEIFLKAPK